MEEDKLVDLVNVEIKVGHVHGLVLTGRRGNFLRITNIFAKHRLGTTETST
jgi:hypothetical protein